MYTYAGLYYVDESIIGSSIPTISRTVVFDDGSETILLILEATTTQLHTELSILISLLEVIQLRLLPMNFLKALPML